MNDRGDILLNICLSHIRKCQFTKTHLVDWTNQTIHKMGPANQVK